MRKGLVLAILAALAVGCASGSRAPVEEPEIRIAQVESPSFLQEQGGLVGIAYYLQIVNKADVPITVKRVEIQTAAGGPYELRPSPIRMDHEVGAGQEEIIEVTAWAYSYGGRSAATEPLTLRITIRFDSSKGPFQISRVQRIAQN